MRTIDFELIESIFGDQFYVIGKYDTDDYIQFGIGSEYYDNEVRNILNHFMSNIGKEITNEEYEEDLDMVLISTNILKSEYNNLKNKCNE